ncbi:MAG: c-type cytochrome [Candidatus Acidiferrales bacterium]
MFEHDPVKVEIFLDDSPEPIGVYRPPATFELDTTRLPDGPHRLSIRAYDQAGVVGVREVRFIVRNGPGIALMGLKNDDIVEGKIPVLINAYAGTHDERWEPTRAETPAPVPTWAWVLFLLVVVWAGYYWFSAGFPPPEYANSPTFSSPGVIEAAAGAVSAREANAGPGFNWAELGARVYQQHCVSCHTAGGEGIPPFVPSLRGAGELLARDPARFLRKTLWGSGGVHPPGKWTRTMPAYADVLSDEEIAAVENYLRTSWGNAAPVVRPEQVTAVRGETRPPR